MANPYKKAVTVQREEDALADIFGDLDNAVKTAPLRSPSPPVKKRKTPSGLNGLSGDTSYGSYRGSASRSGASSSHLATSSDPILGDNTSGLNGSSSFISETGPSSEGLDSLLFGDASNRSLKKQRVSGAEDDIGNLHLDTSLDGNDFADDSVYGKIGKISESDEDENLLQVKTVTKSNNARKRQLVNAASIKVAKPAVNLGDDQDDEKKPDIKPITTLKDASKRKAKGLDWQIAAAAATLDTGEEGDDSMDVDADAFDSAASTSAAKPKKFKAPSAGGVSFSSAKVQALEEDGSLRFYWLDYTENNGVLQFIGKVFDRETRKYVSCCVTVDGIDRNLFVLPRQAGTDEYGNDTPAPTEDEVYEEFGQVASKHNIKEWMGKQVDRKYAFELPDVPKEASYLKVLYSYDRRSPLTGSCYMRVLMSLYRTCFTTRLLWQNVQSSLWYQHKRFRAVCPETPHYGTMLAQHTRSRI